MNDSEKGQLAKKIYFLFYTNTNILLHENIYRNTVSFKYIPFNIFNVICQKKHKE